MRPVSAALFASIFAACASAHETSPPAAPVAAGLPAAAAEASRVVDAFHGALAAGNSKAVLALLDDGVQIYEQGWVERSKGEYAAQHLASDMKFTAATAQTQSARTGAAIGELAYISTEGRNTGNFEGKPVDSFTLETMVLRRMPDGWRIVHIHWSSRKAGK